MGEHTFLIAVDEVTVRLQVGVSAQERARPQPLVVSVGLQCRAPIGTADDLAATIDYDAVIRFLREGLAALPPALLIETVAQRVADFSLSLSPHIDAVTVTVAKPSVLGADGRVSVRLHRGRA